MSTLHSSGAGGGSRTRRSAAAGRFGKSWAGQWQRHRQAFRECLREPSERNVHALRIATRRLLAHLDLWRGTEVVGPALERARRNLKRLMRATSTARDAQVQLRLLDWLTQGKPDHPGLDLFHRSISRRARRRADELVDLLPRMLPDPPGFQPELLFPMQSASFVPFEQAAGFAIGRAYLRLRSRMKAARRNDPTALHRARMALKKLRYMAEVALAAEQDGGASQLGQLHAIQSALGEVHDLDLLLQRMDKFAARRPTFAAWLSARRAVLARRRLTLLQGRPPLRVRLNHLLPTLDPPRRKSP